MQYEQVLNFWFEEIKPESWWKKDPVFDLEIQQRFSGLHSQVTAVETDSWRDSARGSLAEIIVLDQFSSNMFRGLPESFASDSQALTLAQMTIAKEFDIKLSSMQRSFIYMPNMHSESDVIHAEAVKLFEKLEIADLVEFEYKHKEIIDRFGRYPHRNDIFGRQSTAEEIEFLSGPSSSF